MIKVARPRAIEFELSGGRRCVVEPATRGQIDRILALDLEDGEPETEEASAIRCAKVLAIYAEGSALSLATLTPLEEREIVRALDAQSAGRDPQRAAAEEAVGEALKKKLRALLRSAAPSSSATRGRSLCTWAARCGTWMRSLSSRVCSSSKTSTPNGGAAPNSKPTSTAAN